MDEPDPALVRSSLHSAAGRWWWAFMQPGMRFADRWRFTTKIVAAGVAMSVVVTGAGIVYGLALTEGIAASARELAALEHVRRGMGVLRDLTYRRAGRGNDAASPPAGGAPGETGPAQLAARASAFATAACPSSDVDVRLSSAVARLSALDRELATGRSFSTYTMLARELLGCLEETGRRSGIFGDRQVDFVAFALLRDLPVVIETVAKRAAVRQIPNEELNIYAAGSQLIVTDGLERVRAALARIDAKADAPLHALLEAVERGVQEADRDGQASFALVERNGFALAEALHGHVSAVLQQRIDQQRRTGLRVLSLSVLFVGLCVYVVLGAVLAIGKSLNALERGSQAFFANDQSHRIVINSRDEFHALAGYFNRIADQTVELLRQLNEQAQRARQDLENKVEERTHDLSRANQRLSDTVEKLTAAQEALVRSAKMAALGNLVAGVAHEVNTPLGLAYTITTHMQEQRDSIAAKCKAGQLRTEEFDSYLNSVAEGLRHTTTNLQRAASLIENFKQVAVDQSADTRRRFDLDGYLREVVGSLHSLVRKEGHRVEIAVAQDISMDSYPGTLAQILTNVITNAVTHAFEGRQGGVIGVAASREGEDRCRIVISDDGAGMSDEVIKRVFDPFFTTRRGKGGTGLGMHIVYNLVVQRLGGDITCVSAPGKGSTFVLSLPTTAPLPATGGGATEVSFMGISPAR